MLEDRPPVTATDSRASVIAQGTAFSANGAGTGTGPGSRSSRNKRSLLRRHALLVAGGGLALLLVVVVWGAAKVMNPQGTGASSLYQSIDGLASSGSVVLLEQERTNLIKLTAASKELTADSKPTTANLQQLEAASEATTGTPTSTTGTTGTTGVTAPPAPADPTAAMQTAEAMLASFGFGQDQWNCLYNLWERESGWNVYAENPSSGAYGIPQSLPGSKMASSGADWQTDAATQINWGLGYIKSVYGTPCSAWNNEEAYGYY